MAVANKIAPLARKSVRKAIVTLISANLTTLVATYDHETKDFGGQSPVCMIYGDGTAPTSAPRMDSHAYLVSLWWQRDDGQATEDYVDDLSDEMRLLLKTNRRKAGDWSSLTIDESFSNMDYPIIDGVMYRRETIRVVVW